LATAVSSSEVAAEPDDAAQVADGGRQQVDSRVRVVNPVDWHLVDAQAGPLGQHQQLGVEEPAVVADLRQQPVGGVGPDCLEATLGVGEASAHRGA